MCHENERFFRKIALGEARLPLNLQGPMSKMKVNGILILVLLTGVAVAWSDLSESDDDDDVSDGVQVFENHDIEPVEEDMDSERGKKKAAAKGKPKLTAEQVLALQNQQTTGKLAESNTRAADGLAELAAALQRQASAPQADPDAGLTTKGKKCPQMQFCKTRTCNTVEPSDPSPTASPAPTAAPSPAPSTKPKPTPEIIKTYDQDDESDRDSEISNTEDDNDATQDETLSDSDDESDDDGDSDSDSDGESESDSERVVKKRPRKRRRRNAKIKSRNAAYERCKNKMESLSASPHFGQGVEDEKIECDLKECSERPVCQLYPQIHGLNYIGSGYDVVYEKMRLPLIDFTWDEQKMYRSERYMPDQIAYRMVNTHDESNKAKTYTRTKSKEKQHSASASASGGVGAFSASVSISGSSMSAMAKAASGSVVSNVIKKKVCVWMKNGYRSILGQRSARRVYKINLLATPAQLRLRQEALNFLVNNGPKAFVATYGTHYLTSVVLGGKKTYMATISSKQRKSQSASEISVAMSFKAAFVSGSASYGQKNKKASDNAKKMSNVQLWCTGGIDCKGDSTAWAHSCVEHPGLVEQETVPIHYLIPKGSARKAVEAAAEAYMKDARKLKAWIKPILTKWSKAAEGVVIRKNEGMRPMMACCRDLVQEGIDNFCKKWRCGPAAPSISTMQPNMDDLKIRAKERTMGLIEKTKGGKFKYDEFLVLKSPNGEKTIVVGKDGCLTAIPSPDAQGKEKSLFKFILMKKAKPRRKGDKNGDGWSGWEQALNGGRNTPITWHNVAKLVHQPGVNGKMHALTVMCNYAEYARIIKKGKATWRNHKMKVCLKGKHPEGRIKIMDSNGKWQKKKGDGGYVPEMSTFLVEWNAQARKANQADKKGKHHLKVDENAQFRVRFWTDRNDQCSIFDVTRRDGKKNHANWGKRRNQQHHGERWLLMCKDGKWGKNGVCATGYTTNKNNYEYEYLKLEKGFAF